MTILRKKGKKGTAKTCEVKERKEKKGKRKKEEAWRERKRKTVVLAGPGARPIVRVVLAGLGHAQSSGSSCRRKSPKSFKVL